MEQQSYRNNRRGSPYQILGITPNTSQEERKKRYRQLVRQNHPDNGGNREAFELVQWAWGCLEKEEEGSIASSINVPSYVMHQSLFRFCIKRQ